MHKGNFSFSVNSLKVMVTKFEKIGSLKVDLNRGQDTTEKVATAIVDVAQGNIVISGPHAVVQNLNRSYSTV